MSRARLPPGLAVAAVCIAAAIAYAPSFGVPFQFDDEARLSNNRAMQAGAWAGALRWLGNSRVVPSATLLLNYRLGEFDPRGYHAVNFAVHLLATLGVFALARVLCRTPRLAAAWPPPRALWLATAAALLFACHPLQTQAVTYVIQRYASMAALFYVWAVVCYLRGRLRQRRLEAGGATPYFAAATVLAIGAVLSKENAVSLPAALLLGEWVGFGRPRRWRALALGAGAVMAIAAMPLIWKALVWQPTLTPGPPPPQLPFLERLVEVLARRDTALAATRPSPLAYLFTQATVLPRYLRLVVRPWDLNIDHDVPIASGLSGPVIAGAAGLAAFATLGLVLMRRWPLAAFAILWFFVTLSVESSVLPIDDAMMEHRMYLPMAGLAIGGGWVLGEAAARAPRAASAAGAALAAALIALTFARNVVWLSPVTLWLDAAGKSPGKARAQLNAGAAYHRAERLDEAVAHYCRALALAPGDPLARANLELALVMQGKDLPPGEEPLETNELVAFCP